MREDLILFSLLGPAAFAAAIVIGLAAVVLLDRGWKRPDFLLPAMVFPMLMVFALTSVMLISGISGSGEGQHWVLAWANRATSLLLMIAALLRIGHHIFTSRQTRSGVSFLLLAFILYWITNVASPMLLGAHQLISHEYMYSLALGCAALLASSPEGDNMTGAYRDGMLILLAAGLVLLLIRPSLVLSPLEASFLPGMRRYAGLAVHPNSLGPLTVAYLLCLWYLPYRRPIVTRAAWLIGLISLFLAESKTTILAFALIACLTWWIRSGADLTTRLRRQRSPFLLAAVIAVILGGITVLVSIGIFSDVGDRIATWMRSGDAVATVTLTGRDQIWIAAIEEWRRHPVFGYGLSMWDAAYRANVSEFAYHAHNQFFQVLGVAGITGVIGLVTYFLALGAAAFKTAHASKGLTLGLFILLFIRSITEVPLSLQGYGIELLMHLLLLVSIASHSPRKVSSRQHVVAYPINSTGVAT